MEPRDDSDGTWWSGPCSFSGKQLRVDANGVLVAGGLQFNLGGGQDRIERNQIVKPTAP